MYFQRSATFPLQRFDFPDYLKNPNFKMSIYQHVLIWSFKGRLIYFWMACGMQDNEHLSLTPETCDYVTFHGKG